MMLSEIRPGQFKGEWVVLLDETKVLGHARDIGDITYLSKRFDTKRLTYFRVPGADIVSY